MKQQARNTIIEGEWILLEERSARENTCRITIKTGMNFAEAMNELHTYATTYPKKQFLITRK